MKNYDVIIIGGGPTGVALAIELGLNNIKTLVLEKHATPLLSPRAQSINARSMEFFMRWKLADKLISKQLLPPDFPIRGIWCSKLNGKTYATSISNEQLSDDITPQRGLRIPLWLTEETLRSRLKDLSSVTFLKQHNVINVQLDDQFVQVTANNSNNQSLEFQAPYAVACDGANSITRNKVGIGFDELAPSQRVINVIFESFELEKLITVEKGFLFYLLESSRPGAIGPVDLSRGLWYAQIRDDGSAESIDQINIDQLLNDITGMNFNKKIVQAHFWNMHIQLAKHFSHENRVFLVGDSAHAFAPTGGFGLNTGLGDVTNLGWKLAAVVKGHLKTNLLSTYEQERRPVCLTNLTLAKKNAEDVVALRHKFNPSVDPEAFALANAKLAKQFAHTLGATLGYGYFDSPITSLQKTKIIKSFDPAVYDALPLPGYFIPHTWNDKHQSIYDILSATHWTLIISGEENVAPISHWRDTINKSKIELDILVLKKNAYLYKYILIRPDWHIAFSGDEININYFTELL